MSDGLHDLSCWNEQVTQLKSAVAKLLGVVEDPLNMSKVGWDRAYEANRYAHRVLVDVERRAAPVKLEA
jgi:hypothetical protein